MKRNAKYYIASLLVLVAVVLVRGQFASMPVNEWAAAADMSVSRAAACSVRLPDGSVLVAGGTTDSGPVASAELYATDGTFKPVAPMQQPRADAACVALADGRVLVMGGSDGSASLASAELFDPKAGSWSDAGRMSVARSGHTATVTPWGLVVVAGGENSGLLEAFGTNGRFVTLGTLKTPRHDFGFAATADQKVLIAGGTDGTSTLTSVEMYDATTNKLTTAGSMLVARKSFAASALYDGRLIISGGLGRDGKALATTEIFDPSTGSSFEGPEMSVARSGHQSYTLTNNGSVLVVGGNTDSSNVSSSETFEPWTGKFRGAVVLHSARTSMSASLLRRGGVIVAGGKGSRGYLAGTERYGFATVESSKSDYAPGEFASFTGMGWKPGEQVVLNIAAFPIDQHEIEFTSTATADSTGQIKIGGFAIDASHKGMRFLATLAGSQSQAQTIFTDANVAGNVNITITPGTQSFASAFTVTGTVTDGTANTVNGGTVQVFADGIATGGGPFGNPTAQFTATGAISITVGAGSLVPGTHAITVHFTAGTDTGGNTVSAAISNTVTDVVTNTTTVTVNSPALNSSTNFGSNVQFTAALTPAGAAAAISDGTVTFSIIGGASGALNPNPFTLSAPVVANSATVSYAKLPGTCPVGLCQYTVTATFNPSAGDGYATTNSAGVLFDVAPIVPTVLISKLPSGNVTFGTALTLTETVQGVQNVTPTGNGGLLDNGVNITSTSQGLSAGGTAVFNVNNLGVGSHTLSVSYSAAANTFNYNTVADSAVSGQSILFNVLQAASNTSVTANPSPANVGQTVTLTAKVAAPPATAIGWVIGGTGNFIFDGGNLGGTCQNTTVSGGVASCIVPSALLTAGAHNFSFHYLSDASVAASLVANEAQGNMNVVSATSTTVVSAPSASNTLGTTVVYTATVTVSPAAGAQAPMLSVTFLDNGSAPLCGGGSNIVALGAPVSGVSTATCSVAYSGSSAANSAGLHHLTASWPGITGVTGSDNTASPYNETISPFTLTFNTSPTFLPVSPIALGAADTVSVGVNAIPGGILAVPASSFNVKDGSSIVGTSAVIPGGTSSLALPNSLVNAAGNHAITFAYPAGDTNFAVTTSGASTLVVNKGTPTVTPSGFSVTNTFGNAMTVGGTVTGGGTTGPSGTLTFTIGATQLGTCQLVAGTCTLTFTNVAAVFGANTVTIDYGGDSNYLTGTNTGTLNVGTANVPASNLTASPASPAAFGTQITFTLALTASGAGAVGVPAGTVAFTDSVSGSMGGAVTLVNGVASIQSSTLTPGPHTVTATFTPSNANFIGVGITTGIYTINTATTTTTLTPSPASVTLGTGTVTYNFTVTGGPVPPQGTVTINDGGVAISNGAGTCAVTGQALAGGSGNSVSGLCTVIYDGSAADKGAGVHNMTATYAPGGASIGIVAGSTSATKVVNVTTAPATITTPSPASGNPLVWGQPSGLVSVTVTGLQPQTGSNALSGNVNFFDGPTLLNGAPIALGGCVNNVCTASLPSQTFTVGGSPHTITATFLGNAVYGQVTSAPLQLVVNKADTTTLLAAGPNTTYGVAATFTATVSTNAPGVGTPTGTVNFMKGATQIGTGTLSGGQATMSLTTQLGGGGPYTITANYLGDNNAKVSSGTASDTVAPNNATLTVTSNPPSPVSAGSSVTFTATFTDAAGGVGSPAGTVTFTDSIGNVNLGSGVISNGVATLTTNSIVPSLNARTITATFAGPDPNFNTPVVGTYLNGTLNFTVQPGTTTVVLSPTPTSTAIGGTVTYNYSVQGGPAAGPLPTGTVFIQNNGTPISNGSGTCVPTGNTLSGGTGNTATGTCTVIYDKTGAGDRDLGSHSMTAHYVPSGASIGVVLDTVSASVTVTIAASAPTISIPVSSATNSFTYGTPTQFSVTLTPTSPTPAYQGAVLFFDGQVQIASVVSGAGTPQTVAIVLTAGTHSITAKFSGGVGATPPDPNYASSLTSVPLTVTVAKATPVLSMSGAQPAYNTTYAGSAPTTATSIPLTTGTVNVAAVNSGVAPTGSITAIGGNNVTIATLALATNGTNGQAGFTNATMPNAIFVGNGQNLTFTYSGDSNYAAGSVSPNGILTFANGLNVASATDTAVVTSNPVSPVAFGQSVNFTATLTGPGNAATGTINFLVDGNALCTGAVVTNNVAVCTVIANNANGLGPNGPGLNGTHTITVNTFAEGPPANHVLPAPANVTALTFKVGSPTPTITITSDFNPSVYGQTVNLTAIACGPTNAPAPVGQIQLFDGGSSLGSLRQKVSSAANCSTYTMAVPSSGVSLFTGGVHAISATYIALQNDNVTPDPNYVGGNSQTQVPPGVLQQTVNQAGTVTSQITVTANPATIVFGESITLTVTVTPKAPATTGTPTGLVSFTMNGNPLASAVTLTNVGGVQTASLTLNTLPTGTDPILATYQGDTNFSTSSSNNGTPLPITINTDATLTTVNTGGWPSPANYGGQITLGATVCGLQASANATAAAATFANCSNTLPTKPTGTVTFFDGGTQLCGLSGLLACPSIDANGNTNLTILMQNPPFANSSGGAVPGNHVISARYNGDGNFAATISGQQTAQAQTLTINKGNTTTAVVSSVNPSVYGQPVQFTATVLAPNSAAILPTGSVDFVDGGVVIAQNVPIANVGGTMTAVLIAGTGGGAGALSVGQHTISVVYHGDANYLQSSTPISGPQALVENVNKAATSTTIVSSANAANTGQQITLTSVVSVTSPGSGVPTGSVQFINTNTPIQPTVLGTSPVVVTAVPGVGNLYIATLVLTNGLPAGNPQIIASYSGDSNFLGSQSALLTQAVNKTPANITFTSSLNPSIFGNQVTFAVTVTPVPPGSGQPTGQIQIFDGTVSLGIFTLQGGVFNFTTSSLAPGAHAIAVQYNGDTNFQAFTSPAIQQNVSKIPTSLNMTSNAFSAIASQVITLTAVLNPNPVPGVPFASGQIGFYDGTTLIGVANLQSNVATINVSNLSVGLHNLSAIYTGDGFWTGSTSGFFAETITLASTSTQIVSSANPSVFGQPITYTITVAVPFPGTVPASGLVQISDNHNNIGDPISANNGTFNITFSNFTPGVHNLVATFVGNASFASSQSATLPQVVNKAATSTTLAALPNGSTSNQSVTMTAVVSVVSPGVGNPTGTVEFVNTTFQKSLGTAPIKLVGGVYVATLTTTALNQSGSPQILTATYSGDDSFATSTSNPQGQSVFGTQVTAVNGASQTVANYAPDMWVTLYGDNLASTTLTASQVPYPNSLGGTTVTITDANGTIRQAPLYFVSPNQINMLVPTNTAFGLATLTVTNPNGASASTIILVTRTAPGLFTANQGGTGTAAALVQRVKSDGSQSIEQVVQFDSSGKPVPLAINVGTDSIYLQFYGTGIRYNPGLAKVACTVGGQTAQVLYAGAAPGFQGLDQVNVALPAGFNLHGTQNVIIVVDGQAANTVTLTFQ